MLGCDPNVRREGSESSRKTPQRRAKSDFFGPISLPGLLMRLASINIYYEYRQEYGVTVADFFRWRGVREKRRKGTRILVPQTKETMTSFQGAAKLTRINSLQEYV